MPTLRAAILDFDGLIVDTESAGFAALRNVFAEHGAVYSLADYLQIVGTSNGVVDPLGLLEQRTGKSWSREAFDAACEVHERRLHQGLTVLPGVTEWLDAAAALGWKLGVASSSSHAWVDGFLARFGLRPRFDAVVCRGDAPRVKPEPDLYLEIVRRFGVAADEAVAFEDSYNGSLAAKRAGLWCVAIPNAITATQDFSHCDLQLPSLAGLTPASLVRQLPPHCKPAPDKTIPPGMTPPAGPVSTGQ